MIVLQRGRVTFNWTRRAFGGRMFCQCRASSLALPTVGDLAGFGGGAVLRRAGCYGEERGGAVGHMSSSFQRARRWSDQEPTVGITGRACRAGGSRWWVAGNLWSGGRASGCLPWSGPDSPMSVRVTTCIYKLSPADESPSMHTMTSFSARHSLRQHAPRTTCMPEQTMYLQRTYPYLLQNTLRTYSHNLTLKTL